MADSHAIAEQEQEQRLSDIELTNLGRILGHDLTNYRTEAAELLEKVADWRDQYESNVKKPSSAQSWQSNVAIQKTKAVVDTIAENVSSAICGTDPYVLVEAEDADDKDAEDGMEAWLQDWNDRMRLKSKMLLAVREAGTVGQAWLWPTVSRNGKPAPMWTGEPLKIGELDVVPKCKVVITEDMALIPATAPNFDQARGAFARVYLRWNDIRKALKAEEFYKFGVDKLKTEWMESHPQTQQQETQGITPEEPEEIWGARFECWEGIYRWVKPGENEEREWLILAAWRSDRGADAIILRCSPYDEIYGGQWFFSPITLKPRPNSMWGEPVCEIMRGSQAWMNATFSQITDAITISILPPIAIPQGQELQLRKFQWAPLSRWPVSNPADVRVLESSASSLAAIGHAAGMMGMVREEIERGTGVTDYTQGKISSEKRTATEMSAVVESGNIKFNVQVANVQFGLEFGDGLEGYTRGLVNLLDKFLPKVPISHKMSRNGRSIQQVFDPAWYQYTYKYVPNGSSRTTNPQARLQRAIATREAVAQSPFTKVSPLDTPDQLLDKVQRLWTAENEYHQAMGHQNTEKIIGDEPQTFDDALAVAFVLDPQAAAQVGMRAAQELGLPTPMLQPAGAGVPGAIGGGAPPEGVGGGEGVPGPAPASGMAPV